MEKDCFDFVDISVFIPSIELDIRYATTNNFVKKPVYEMSKCFLRKGCAKKLKQAQEFFESLGFSLKIFDGYRPLSVQHLFWELVPDERYVANPAKGSKHNRGSAVDITLLDENGNELNMGTEFDSFEEIAHVNYVPLSPEVYMNRCILQKGMIESGFAIYPYEWWHFDDTEWENYPICDISFQELAAVSI